MFKSRKNTALQLAYKKISGAIAYIAVESPDGKVGIGTAFHIGDGIFVTARHVIHEKKITEIGTTKKIPHPSDGNKNKYEIRYNYPEMLEIIDGPHFLPETDDHQEIADVALFKTSASHLPAIQMSSELDHDIDDDDFILDDVIIVGYPPIPYTLIPNQVAVSGQINATVDVRHSKYLHYIASIIARGGFSGGVVLTEDGYAIGMVTESLIQNGAPPESGFMSILSIQAVIDMAEKFYEFDLEEHGIFRAEERLVEIKLTRNDLKLLNSRSHNAMIYVYDDDRDTYGEIHCSELNALQSAIDAFNEVTPISIIGALDQGEGAFCFSFDANPKAALMKVAAQAAAVALADYGYEQLSRSETDWQITRC